MVSAAGQDELAPYLEAAPSADGLITWWLYSPVQASSSQPLKPPLKAREGAPVLGGRWAVSVTESRFNDFKPFLIAYTGELWAAARLRNQAGGPRKLRVYSYCAVSVFLDGKPVLELAQPVAKDEASAVIQLPKGTCELSVGVRIRSGYCGFELSLTDNSRMFGQARAVGGDRILLPTAAGQAPDADAAAVRSVVFAPADPFVTPGQPTALLLLLRGSTPCNLGPLEARFTLPNGTVISRPIQPASGERLPAPFAYPVPKDAGAIPEVSAEITAGGKVLGRKSVRLVCPESLAAASIALRNEIAGRAVQAGRPLPNAMLAADKLELFAKGLLSGEEVASPDLARTLADLLDNARKLMPVEAAGTDPWAGKFGYFERAYQSRIDESAQPYQVQVPGAYVQAQASGAPIRFPLVVFLHGYVPSYNKHRWWEPFDEFDALLEQHCAFLAVPFGRANTDFQSCGEVDVLDVIAEMKRLYPIDDDRVYLWGYSMGGMAVYTLGAHHPDLFAAAIAMAGRADSPLQNFRPLNSFHPFKQWLIQADNPISLCENFLNIPLRVYHGADDLLISSTEARRMERRLREVGCDAQLTLLPGSHYVGLGVMASEKPLEWLLNQKRKNAPAKRHMKTYSLHYARQGEVEVTATTGALRPIELAWTYQGGKVVFTQDSDLVVQRRVRGELIPPALGQPVKTPQLCGPVRQAICGPFILVYGTSGTPEANARNQANAEQFAAEWYAFGKGRAIIKADKDVTDAEKGAKNLFLFGEEQENLLHAAAAGKLPFKVRDGQVSLGAKSVPLDGKGFMYMYPSPFAQPGAGCAVVICAGLPYGHDVSFNHKLDLVPDFLLYDGRIDADSTSTNHAICAGFFDGYWKLKPESMWWFDN